MKRIRCPRCDEPITFDDSLYTPGRVLVFECPDCRKQFKIRVAVKDVPRPDVPEEEDEDAEPERTPIGHIVVIENAFHLRQEILLYEGENSIGRHVRGTKATAPIKTVDPSVDTTHCHITGSITRQGTPKFVLRDGPSGTGTFLMNEILGPRDRVTIEDGAIITIGATTLILRDTLPDEEED